MKHSSEERMAFVAKCAEFMAANPTPAEKKLWTLLEPLGFRNQVMIVGATKNGGSWWYIADFAKLETCDGRIISGLIVEVDGSAHRNRKGRDRRRDVRLAGEGIRTIRFKNNTVIMKPDLCCDLVECAMEALEYTE